MAETHKCRRARVPLSRNALYCVPHLPYTNMILQFIIAIVLIASMLSAVHGFQRTCFRSAVVSFQRSPSTFFSSSSSSSSSSFRLHATLKPQITKLIARQDLTTDETEDAWKQILSGADPATVGAMLTLLRAKGETPKEIAGMVKAMQSACLPVKVDGKLLDIVGTGGDGADTINISTASVILSAACGCKVAKAGNRSVSSRCGSADVLEMLGNFSFYLLSLSLIHPDWLQSYHGSSTLPRQLWNLLGVQIEMSPDKVARCITESGIGFMYAPINHPAMKAVAPVRKALGVRTAFNLLGNWLTFLTTLFLPCCILHALLYTLYSVLWLLIC